MFIALIAPTTSLKFSHDSERKYFVRVDTGNVPRYKFLFSKIGQIGYVTRDVNKPLIQYCSVKYRCLVNKYVTEALQL